jgi:modulator of FtsH protease
MWSEFFVAIAGAAAALTGLIFVGVSINLTRILSFSRLPDRAFQAIILMLTVLIIQCCVSCLGNQRSSSALNFCA